MNTADFRKTSPEDEESPPGCSGIFISGKTKAGRFKIQSNLTWEPSADVIESESEILVIVDIAGMDNRDINVMTDGRILRISGDRRIKAAKGGNQFHQMEIQVGPFRRAIELPSAVDPGKIAARYRKGMLEIRVKKLDTQKTVKKIKID